MNKTYPHRPQEFVDFLENTFDDEFTEVQKAYISRMYLLTQRRASNHTMFRTLEMICNSTLLKEN